MQKHLPSLAVLAAGTLWGIVSIFVRQLSAVGLSSLQIGLLRCSIASVLLLVWLLRTPEILKIRLRDLWCFLGTGIVSLTFFSWCYFTTIRLSEASVAVVLLYTSPIFVMLFSALLFREKMTKRKLSALVMTFAGSVLVSGLATGSARLTPTVFLIGLGAGFGYALYSIFSRFALERGYSSLTVTFYTFVFSGLSTLLLCHPTEIPALMTASLLPSALAVAFLCSVLPYLFYTWGLSRMESGKAAILATIEPLVGAVVGIALYQESHDLPKLLGIALIFAAVAVLNDSQ